ncbi:putative membrane protein [Nocardioides sp. BE266]|uniref:DUF2306 domain-containing protein n=1 Tax=Nocardioides sp. BE266 TaxID=2817725 RepID=UPI00285D1185|nr:DUF2306 domain-containing protein [Nocardioides sp. BE266]MDR7252294.1 putative membrane protein [Nocardioides sp. BE266]
MTRRADRLLPVVLLALCFVPVLSGTLRLVQLAGGPEIMPADDRFLDWPMALVVHIVGSAVFAVGCVFQLVPTIRRRHPDWHRRAGRVLAVAGLMVAGSALWLTLFYDPQPGTGPLLLVLRLVVAPAMAGCLVVGVAAARRRDFRAHRAWMIRGYALALGAGTQVFTLGFGEAVLGHGELRGDLLRVAAWVINLAVAEWAIRRPARRRTSRARRVPAEVVSP